MLYHYYAIALLCYCIILLLHYIVIMLYHYTLVLLECYRGVTVCVLLSIKLSLLCYCYYNFVITAKPQKLLVFRLTGTCYGSCCFITCHQWPEIVSIPAARTLTISGGRNTISRTMCVLVRILPPGYFQ